MTMKQILAEISWVVSGVANEASVILAKTYERTIEDGWSGANKWAGEGIVGIVTNSVGIKIFFMKKRQKEPLTIRSAYVTHIGDIRVNKARVCENILVFAWENPIVIDDIDLNYFFFFFHTIYKLWMKKKAFN